MKLIDDNGKLFGKVNFIDFLVILFVVWGVTSVGIAGWKGWFTYATTARWEAEQREAVKEFYAEALKWRGYFIQLECFLDEFKNARKHFSKDLLTELGLLEIPASPTEVEGNAGPVDDD